MSTYRSNAVAAGVLFIVATAAGVFGLGMLGDSLSASDVPRWLSVWGLVAISMSIAANLLNFFRILDATSAAYVPLHLPIFAQEMVLAVWLIWKGFAPVQAAPSRA